MTPLSPEEIDQLIEAARHAASRAYAPYSDFPVGAAALTEDGQVFSGANIENASYGLTQCAERTALSMAVSAGYGRHTEKPPLRAMAVWASRNPHGAVTPCGACRQIMAEFCPPEMEVLFTHAQTGEISRFCLKELLPVAFGL